MFDSRCTNGMCQIVLGLVALIDGRDANITDRLSKYLLCRDSFFQYDKYFTCAYMLKY